MIKELIQLANKLDEKGFMKEADYVDLIIKKSQDMQYGLPKELRDKLKKFILMGADVKKEKSKLPEELQKEYDKFLKENPAVLKFLNREIKSPDLEKF